VDELGWMVELGDGWMYGPDVRRGGEGRSNGVLKIFSSNSYLGFKE